MSTIQHPTGESDRPADHEPSFSQNPPTAPVTGPEGEEASSSPRESPRPAGADDPVLRAQEQLQQLRQQQELLERQKRELQALSQRQAEFEAAREEIGRKLNRAIVALEREQYEAEREVEHLRACRDKLEHQLNHIEAIDPSGWVKSEVGKELNRAMSEVEDAEAELTKASARVNAERGGEVLPRGGGPGAFLPGELGFGFWLRAGLAFTLPLALIFLLAFGVFFYLLLAAGR